jgi:arginase
VVLHGRETGTKTRNELAIACTKPLAPDQITVLGWRDAQGSTLHGMTADEIRAEGALAAARQTLDQMAQDAVILLHFDVDALDPLVMPAAYSPCITGQGLTQEEAQVLLSAVLKDPRVQAIEVTEYSALGDHTGASAHLIVDLLAAAMIWPKRVGNGV